MLDKLVLKDEKAIKVLSDPLHIRMLSALRKHGAQTSSGLARIMGEDAARLHYHLKRMEGAGLVEVERVESIHGINARYMRPSARSFMVGNDPALSVKSFDSVREMVEAAFSGMLELCLARIAEAEAARGKDDGPDRREIVTVSDSDFLLGPDEVADLERELEALGGKYATLTEANRAKAVAGDVSGDAGLPARSEIRSLFVLASREGRADLPGGTVLP